MLAALGPKMLDLARERTFGAHPYFVPPEHTAQARERLGPGQLLAPEQAVLLVSSSRRRPGPRPRARPRYLQLPNYVNNLRRLGFTDEDVAATAATAWSTRSSPGAASTRCGSALVAHLDAGADHVAVQALGPRSLEQLLELAPGARRRVAAPRSRTTCSARPFHQDPRRPARSCAAGALRILCTRAGHSGRAQLHETNPRRRDARLPRSRRRLRRPCRRPARRLRAAVHAQDRDGEGSPGRDELRPGDRSCCTSAAGPPRSATASA